MTASVTNIGIPAKAQTPSFDTPITTRVVRNRIVSVVGNVAYLSHVQPMQARPARPARPVSLNQYRQDIWETFPHLHASAGALAVHPYHETQE